MRYLLRAFLARPDIPLLRLPWNALGIVAAAVAGFWDPSVWAVAGAGELIYLFTLASNAGFQRSIDDARHEALSEDTEESRRKLLSQVGGAARQRYVKLEEKRRRLETLFRDHAGDDLFFESNRDAMQKLTWLYLNLLVAQRNLVLSPHSDPRELEKQIAACERELASAPSARCARLSGSDHPSPARALRQHPAPRDVAGRDRRRPDPHRDPARIRAGRGEPARTPQRHLRERPSSPRGCWRISTNPPPPTAIRRSSSKPARRCETLARSCRSRPGPPASSPSISRTPPTSSCCTGNVNDRYLPRRTHARHSLRVPDPRAAPPLRRRAELRPRQRRAHREGGARSSPSGPATKRIRSCRAPLAPPPNG